MILFQFTRRNWISYYKFCIQTTNAFIWLFFSCPRFGFDIFVLFSLVLLLWKKLKIKYNLFNAKNLLLLLSICFMSSTKYAFWLWAHRHTQWKWNAKGQIVFVAYEQRNRHLKTKQIMDTKTLSIIRQLE